MRKFSVYDLLTREKELAQSEGVTADPDLMKLKGTEAYKNDATEEMSD
ncbi:MAG: hypothetical protein U9N52_02525 [Campylobacterota bacterium]|nr:hypothetical protein [Campylobacterota bacterium]